MTEILNHSRNFIHKWQFATADLVSMSESSKYHRIYLYLEVHATSLPNPTQQMAEK
jgi:hypothetical protein